MFIKILYCFNITGTSTSSPFLTIFLSYSLALHVCLHSLTHIFLFYLIRVPIGCHICAQCQEGADGAESQDSSSSFLVGRGSVLRPLTSRALSVCEGNLGTCLVSGGKTVPSHISELIHEASKGQERLAVSVQTLHCWSADPGALQRQSFGCHHP